jgi:hypothetical protein
MRRQSRLDGRGRRHETCVRPFQVADESTTPLFGAAEKRRVANRIQIGTGHREEPRTGARATLADADEFLPISDDLAWTKPRETPQSRPRRAHERSGVGDEIAVGSLEFAECLPPQPPNETGSARDVEVEERVIDRHEDVEPDLGPGGNEDRSPTTSSSHEFGTEGDCRGTVDRSEGLCAPEHDGWTIRIAKGRHATRGFWRDDELARIQATLDDREPLTSNGGSARAQIPTAIPNEGAT